MVTSNYFELEKLSFFETITSYGFIKLMIEIWTPVILIAPIILFLLYRDRIIYNIKIVKNMCKIAYSNFKNRKLQMK